MKRLAILFCALLFCSGCFSDSDKAAWNAAFRDWRGDNQQMRNDSSGQLDHGELRQP
jgi:hypothetical protein